MYLYVLYTIQYSTLMYSLNLYYKTYTLYSVHL